MSYASRLTHNVEHKDLIKLYADVILDRADKPDQSITKIARRLVDCFGKVSASDTATFRERINMAIALLKANIQSEGTSISVTDEQLRDGISLGLDAIYGAARVFHGGSIDSEIKSANGRVAFFAKKKRAKAMQNVESKSAASLTNDAPRRRRQGNKRPQTHRRGRPFPKTT